MNEDDEFPLEFVNCSNEKINEDNENKSENKSVDDNKQSSLKRKNSSEIKHSYSIRPRYERVEMEDDVENSEENIIDEIRNNGADYNINFICETEYNEDSNENFDSVQVKQEAEDEIHIIRNDVVQPPSIVGRPSQKQGIKDKNLFNYNSRCTW